MSPTVDRFRALARSSPWRWTSLHLTRHGDPDGAAVGAWVDRATSTTRLRDAAGRPHRVVEEPGATSVVAWAADGPLAAPPRTRHVPPRAVVPPLDPDGLVAVRPDHLEDADGTSVFVEYGDPVWGDYQWVAMLDPVELSHHVRLTDLVACERRGRETWTATAVPEPGYEPTCACCPLLSSDISHRVSLDVGTGVVVVLAPHGEGHGVDGWSVEIHQVDGPDPFG